MLKRFTKYPTIFLIAATLVIPYSIIMFLYGMQLPGGGSLGAMFYAGFAFIGIVALVIDIVLIEFLNFKIVWVIEICIVLILISVEMYDNKTANIVVQDAGKSYIIIVDDDKGLSLAQFRHSGLFDKEYIIKDNVLLRLNRKSFNGYNINYIFPPKWGGYGGSSLYYKPHYTFDWEFAEPKKPHVIYTDKQRDSLLQLSLPANTKIHDPEVNSN